VILPRLLLANRRALYALLATGIGAVAFAFGAAICRDTLAHEGRPAAEARRSGRGWCLFLGMTGLACHPS
jgi:hypothetical protein